MFQGVYTAIVTPFDGNEKVDRKTLRNLVKYQIDNGVAGIVPCGTTGESPTLTEDEWRRVVSTVVECADHRVKVIAGTGSNCTAKTVKYTQAAEKLGVDAALVVNPYYNKPTQEGLYRHFKAVADSVHIPIVLYNIKGRTGVNIETPTLMRLVHDCKNIVAVKEASGDFEQMKDVISRVPHYFDVLSGDDNMTLRLIQAGGKGVISVVSNIVPGKVVKMVEAALSHNPKAKGLNDELIPLYEAAFIETNPIPVKAILAEMGLIKEVYRLPLCELMPENRRRICDIVKEHIIKEHEEQDIKVLVRA